MNKPKVFLNKSTAPDLIEDSHPEGTEENSLSEQDFLFILASFLDP
jgi:hypothetical protein